MESACTLVGSSLSVIYLYTISYGFVFQRNSWHCDGIYDNAGLAVLHETHAVHVLEYALSDVKPPNR